MLEMVRIHGLAAKLEDVCALSFHHPGHIAFHSVPCLSHAFSLAVIKRTAALLACCYQGGISFPTEDELPLVEAGFASRRGMRGVVGAIDGTLIRICLRTKEEESAYWCRKRKSLL